MTPGWYDTCNNCSKKSSTWQTHSQAWYQSGDLMLTFCGTIFKCFAITRSIFNVKKHISFILCFSSIQSLIRLFVSALQWKPNQISGRTLDSNLSFLIFFFVFFCIYITKKIIIHAAFSVRLTKDSTKISWTDFLVIYSTFTTFL